MQHIDFFGQDAEFDHVGVAVASLDKAMPGLEQTLDPHQQVRVAFVQLHGVCVELVEPAGDQSPVAGLVRKGQHLYHVCYRVSDLEAAMRQARQHGLHCIAQPAPAPAFQDRRIAWVYSRAFGLFELLEKRKATDDPDG